MRNRTPESHRAQQTYEVETEVISGAAADDHDGYHLVPLKFTTILINIRLADIRSQIESKKTLLFYLYCTFLLTLPTKFRFGIVVSYRKYHYYKYTYQV